MKKLWKGILCFMPLVVFVMAFGTILYACSEMGNIRGAVLFFLASIIFIWIIMIWLIIKVVKRTDFSAGKKALWILLLVLFNIFAFIVYWFKYISEKECIDVPKVVDDTMKEDDMDGDKWKVWWHETQQKKSRYSWTTIGKIFGFVLWLFMLVYLVNRISETSSNIMALYAIGCVFVLSAIILIYGALSMRRRSFNSIMVYCRDDCGRFFVIDISKLAPGEIRVTTNQVKIITDTMNRYRGTEQMIEAMKSERVLERRLENGGSVADIGYRILQVQRISEGRTGYTAICTVQSPIGASEKWELFVGNDYEDAAGLRREFNIRCR